MSNVPKLRFKEFSGEWEEKQLGEIANFHNSKRIPLTDSDRIKGIYPYYGASGIIDYVHDYIFDGEYILLGEDGANIVMRNSRLAFLAKGKFWLNNHAHIFQAKESNSFLCEALERINYTKYNTGSAQPKLNAEIVKKIKLNLPQKQEQEKIASFLTSVDTKIEQLAKKESLLQEYKKGVMQKIFNQEIRFKDDDGSEFREWEEKKFSEIVIEYRLGGNYSNTENKTEFPLIKMGNINRGKVNLSKLEYITTNEDIEEIDKIKYGDLFFNTRNTLDLVGKVAIWRNELPTAYYNSNLMYIKFGNNFFMNYRLNSYEGLKAFRRIATGTTSVAAIYTKDLLKVVLSIPSLKEQIKIANFISSIDNKIEQNKKQLEQTKEFKKALLQRMFV